MEFQYLICVNIYYGCASHAASVLGTRQCPEQRHGTAQQRPKAERQQAEEKPRVVGGTHKVQLPEVHRTPALLGDSLQH
jgi:hypothetical protein